MSFAPISAEEEELLRLMQSGSRAQSRARFESETGYASAGGSAVQQHLGRSRQDLPFEGREPDMGGGVNPVSQDVPSAVAGGARGTRKNFYGCVCHCAQYASERTCECVPCLSRPQGSLLWTTIVREIEILR